MLNNTPDSAPSMPVVAPTISMFYENGIHFDSIDVDIPAVSKYLLERSVPEDDVAALTIDFDGQGLSPEGLKGSPEPFGVHIDKAHRIGIHTQSALQSAMIQTMFDFIEMPKEERASFDTKEAVTKKTNTTLTDTLVHELEHFVQANAPEAADYYRKARARDTRVRIYDLLVGLTAPATAGALGGVAVYLAKEHGAVPTTPACGIGTLVYVSLLDHFKRLSSTYQKKSRQKHYDQSPREAGARLAEERNTTAFVKVSLTTNATYSTYVDDHGAATLAVLPEA